MTFVLEDKNTNKKYDFISIMKHQDVCRDILERMECEDKAETESYKRVEKRLELLSDMVDVYDYAYLDENKLKGYREILERIEQKAQNGIVTEMYYITESKELLKQHEIVSRQLERKKRMLHIILEKYLDSFKLLTVKIYGTKKVLYKQQIMHMDSDYESD
jgi:hypothetical protein